MWPQRAEPSLWIPTSPPHPVSPATLLPFCSCLLSCYFTFPLFSWPQKALEAIGCLHLCLSLTAHYSPLSRSQGLWWPSLPLGHCSVVILVSSRLSISLDSMYFLFCILLNFFLLDNDFYHTHSFVFPVLEMQLNLCIRREVLCCIFRSRMELKKICWMKGYKILRENLYSLGALKVLSTCLRRGSGEPHTFNPLLLWRDCFSLFESTTGMPFLTTLSPCSWNVVVSVL